MFKNYLQTKSNLCRTDLENCQLKNLFLKCIQDRHKPIYSTAENTLVKPKNPAYGRHRISRPMQIVGPIQFWGRWMLCTHPPFLGLHACNKMGSTPVLPQKIRKNQQKKNFFLRGDFRPLLNKNVQF